MMDMNEQHTKRFGELIRKEQQRLASVNEKKALPKSADEGTVIAVLPGDGIGPIIMEQAIRVLSELLKEELASNEIRFSFIEGLTLENRLATGESVPEAIMAEIKSCPIILKGPMTTPKASDAGINLTSANAILRRELDLFANIRPVKMPHKGIDWTFFRENTEGPYALGSDGLQIDDDLSIDFVVESRTCTERIARSAFEYAKNNGKGNVTVVTKANIIKRTDGNFLNTCREIAQEYDGIQLEERLVDVTAARLTNPEFHKGLEVFVLPNLYGDIITDIAAEYQGGLGTAGSANIGTDYAIFEAIHGSAPFLVENNRAEFADPSSLLRAVVMLLNHIGKQEQANRLEKALDICGSTEKRIKITSFREDASTKEYADYILEKLTADYAVQ